MRKTKNIVKPLCCLSFTRKETFFFDIGGNTSWKPNWNRENRELTMILFRNVNRKSVFQSPWQPQHMQIRVCNETQQNEAVIQSYWAVRLVTWINTHDSINKRQSKRDPRSFQSHLGNMSLNRECVQSDTNVRLPTFLASNFEIIQEITFIVTYDIFGIVSSSKAIFRIFQII